METGLRQPTAGALSAARPTQNLGEAERLISGALGAASVLWGVRQGGATGGFALLAGAALIGRGASGYCPLTAALSANAGGAADRARPWLAVRAAMARPA